MSLTKILYPAALVLLVWGGWMAVSGLRQRNRFKLYFAAVAFAIVLAGAWVLMEFLTRPF